MAPRNNFRRSPRRDLKDGENQPELSCDGTLSPDQEAFPRQELLASLAKLRLDPQYSDLTIICGDQVYWVHKSIICPRSAFFAKACNGNFQEAYANKVALQEEPALVRQMIEYLYTLDYQVDTLSESAPFSLEDIPTALAKSGTTETDSAYQEMAIQGDQDSLNTSKSKSDFASYGYDPLSFHILMYALADRMFIEGLKGLSKRKVEQELLQRLDASSFPSAIVEIYKSTPSQDRGLRDLAVRVTMHHLTRLRSEDEESPAPFQNSLLQSVPQFLFDLAIAMMDNTVTEWARFGECKKDWSRNAEVSAARLRVISKIGKM